MKRIIFIIGVIIMLFSCKNDKNKCFVIEGYEDIITPTGPKERDEKFISENGLDITYSCLSIVPAGYPNLESRVYLKIINKDEKDIQITNIKWDHIYNEKPLKGLQIGEVKDNYNQKLPVILKDGDEAVYYSYTPLKEKDFKEGDKISVDIEIEYIKDNKKYTLVSKFNTICQLRTRPSLLI